MIDTPEEMEQLSGEALQGPIPGGSLTQDPENPQAYEQPPEYVNVEDFVDALFMNLTNEDNIDGVLDPIRKQVPIEDVAQMLLFQAQATGKINPDLMLLSVEPVIYMLIGLSEYAGIENPVLYPEDPMIDAEGDEISKLEQAIQEDEDIKFEDLPTPQGVSKSLVEKMQQGEI